MDDHRLRYTIGGKEFALPVEVTYRQYEALSKHIAAIQARLVAEGDPKPGVMNVVRVVLQSGKVPEILATLLIPAEAEVWKTAFAQENVECMQDIGDRTAVEIISNFLSGRMSLTEGMTASLSAFSQQSVLPETSSKPSPIST